MPSPKPTRSIDDKDRRIQQFLERAANIVLEDPALTAERWQQLSAIASDYGLTSDEFRGTLDDLVARGVLRRVETTIPKPPPLPRGRPVTESRPPPTPPIRPSAPTIPPTRVSVSPALRPAPGSSEITRDDLEPDLVQPASMVNEVSPAPEVPMREPAKEPQRASAATSRPESSETPNVAAEKVAGDKIDGRWRVEGAPVPVPARPTKKPHEIYLDFVGQSLKYIDNHEISSAVEHRLIYHGTRVLSLSAVYAKHLLQQVAAEHGFHFSSQHNSAHATETTHHPAEAAAWKDPDEPVELATDLPEPFAPTTANNAASIVRVAEPKVAALTTESLRQQAASRSDYRQLERVVPLREYLHVSLDRVPRGLLPLSLLEKLIADGTDLFGVHGELVLETVRYVAGELKIVVVTQQQAEEHVSALVSDLLDHEVSLSPDQWEQVRQSGLQWGLNASQSETLVRQLCSAKQAVRRREEITTRLALAAAGIAVLLVVSFIGYAFVNAQSNRKANPPSPSVPASDTVPPEL